MVNESSHQSATQGAPAAGAHRMPFGAEIGNDGRVCFRLWAPAEDRVRLRLDDEGTALDMTRVEGGWHELVTDKASAGSRYRFELGSGQQVPDPASRYQPEDVHGPSEVVDPGAYAWSDEGWRGRPWHETVLYELHVGTFTPEGTFRAAIDRLDHLVELGVTAIELLPVADFPGRWNWGYDGVLLYAPDASYGRPEDLKALVDAAHARGLMVFLDVVYNHFGPEGNYIGLYAPPLYTERHKTPWGAAINYDGPDSRPVREFVIHNALYWLEEFRFDGLRLDAVHAIVDDSPKHLLKELAKRVRAHFPADRHVHLVLENDANQACFLERGNGGAPKWHTAQWADDLHHGLHVAATGESVGYYADYHGDLAKLGRALAEGFAYQGEPSAFKDGEPRGEPSAHLPPTAFVSFLQNHDQIGNRAMGDRIAALAPPEAVKAVAALYLLSPTIPMLYMGEEWGTRQPFPFFCDFGPELAVAVREGRREEFGKFPEFADPEARERIPDPTAPSTFELAKLPWAEVEQEPHASWLAWYRRILQLRRERIVPLIPAITGNAGSYEILGTTGLQVSWQLPDGRRLLVQANLSPEPLTLQEQTRGETIWRARGEAGQAVGQLDPWEVAWSLAQASALDRLANRMGIEPFYGSAAGGTIHTSAESKRLLLAAIGIDAPDEEAAQARLDELQAEELAQPLPPVLVVREDRLPAPVALRLPVGTGSVRWRLTEEGGETRDGTVAFATLGLVAQHGPEDSAIEVRSLLVPGPLPLGYHSLRIEAGERTAEMPLIVTPSRCYLPEPLARNERIWGIAAQLYTVRSAPDWGMGDFGDLRNLVTLAANRGAAVIGLNPLHAMFLDRPEHASPYSPASRLFLNVLYIDPTAIPELMACEPVLTTIAAKNFQERLERLSAERLVDYRAAAEIKLPLLEKIHAVFREAATPERRAAFEAFRRELGEPLERFCLFQALREHVAAEDAAKADWRSWPEEFHDPGSPAARRFREEHRERIEFLLWLQWVADTQLAAAADLARQHGMPVGLYRDLAVGADASGAETWSNPGVVISTAQVGAPPDIFNPAGQNWGLPPFAPHRLRAEAYRSFTALVRANMRHAGGLRIDHVMALQHLYWIPAGRPASEGAYVAYPMDDLLGILALESHRHQCLVVGEDLGTVPPGFRERMAEYAVLSYRVLFFEWRDDGSFKGPDEYPYLALSTIGSHDLATLRGWWEGHDIQLKAERGLYPSADEAKSQRERRSQDRAHLLDALHAAGLALPASFDADSPWSEALESAAHAFLARTGSAIAMVQIDDLTGEIDQINLPGTVDEYPNWRRKLTMTLEQLADDARACALMNAVSAVRGASAGTGKGSSRGETGRAIVDQHATIGEHAP